jgi:AraC-like DNA-binding protein
MKYIFLIASFQAFFFTILLVQKKSRSLHDHILTSWLIYLGIFIGIYGIYSHDLFTHFKLLSISLLSLFLLHGPFLYAYISILVPDKKQLPEHYLWHLLPFALFNLYILIASFFPELSDKLNIEKLSHSNDPPLLFLAFLILTTLSGPVYFLLTIKLFKKLDINIFNNFSNSEKIDLYWIRILVLVFGIVWTALIAITVVHHIFHLFPMVFCTNGLFLSLSVYVILIGYFGLKQKVIFTPENILILNDTSEFPIKYAQSKLDSKEAKQYAGKLVQYMETSHPYLDPDLTLPQLASGIGISTHLLSQVINEQFEINFFDFVNKYRVNEFKERIAKPEFAHYSLLAVAFDCGFNSKSAFNRIFKKTTGYTPSQYKDSINR